jgi:predicted MFS family arabinose efflux permease
MTSLAGFPSLIPSMVPAHQLDQANALEGVSFGLASLTGAALAGVGAATVGPAWVMVADALTYLLFAVALMSVRTLPRPVPARPRSRGGLGRVARRVLTNPTLRDTTIMFALFNVGEGCLLVVLPYRAVDLGLGTGGYGYLAAATTAGELAATAFLVAREWHRPLRVSILIAQLVAAGVVTMLIAHSVLVTLLVLVAVGVLTAPMTAWAQTLRMRLVPAEEHGRLFALLRTAMQATPPLGAGLAALTMPHGTTVTVLSISAVMGLPALVLAGDLLGQDPDADQDQDDHEPQSSPRSA